MILRNARVLPYLSSVSQPRRPRLESLPRWHPRRFDTSCPKARHWTWSCVRSIHHPSSQRISLRTEKRSFFGFTCRWEIWVFHVFEDSSHCLVTRVVMWSDTNVSEHLATSVTLKMKAAWSSETLVSYQTSTRRQNREGRQWLQSFSVGCRSHCLVTFPWSGDTKDLRNCAVFQIRCHHAETGSALALKGSESVKS